MKLTKFKADYFGDKEKVSKRTCCEWCLDLAPENKKKEEPVFACIPFGQSGWSSPMIVCRNCLMSIVNNEVENIRVNIQGLPYEESDKQAARLPLEIEIIKNLAFMGLE